MVTRTQLVAFNPATLTSIADAWTALGASAEGLFDRYQSSVTRAGEIYWEGTTADAVQARATADKAAVGTVVDALDAVATTARQGFYEIDAPLQRAKAAIVAAESDGFTVSESLVITDSDSDPDDARVALLAERVRELDDAVTATIAADELVKGQLAAARVGLTATFTSAATSGGDQGRTDGAALAKDPSSLTPEQIRRIQESAHLTDAQLDALARGETAAIPASQMEYLNQLSTALDGKSPQEIAALLSNLSPDNQAAVANSLQILSNEKVTASVRGDAEIPTNGGLDWLPTGMKESLTRDDLTVIGYEQAGNTMLPSIALNGVADNKAIASIVSKGDDRYQNGTALDSALLDVGRQYLDAQVAHEQNPDSKFEFFTVDGRGTQDMAITEDIFSAVGVDKIAVEAAVDDPDHGDDFVKDVLAHNWTDDGKAASTLFQFADGDATISDPNNANDVATATRTGNIMESVARAASTDDAWEYLRNIPGTDEQSVGQLNPELLRTVSSSMSPYVGILAGGGSDDVAGFGIGDWADPADNLNYAGSSNIFALMNTDDAAGTTFTQAAIAEELALEGRFVANPSAPFAESNLLTTGALLGLTDKGMTMALQDQYDDEAAHAQDVYARKEAAYTALTTLGSFGIDQLKGGEYINLMIDASGDSLQESMIGEEPGEAKNAAVDAPNFYLPAYNILSMSELPPEFEVDYKVVFDQQGNLMDWDAAKDAGVSQSDIAAAYSGMLKQLAGSEDDAQLVRNGYDDAMRDHSEGDDEG
ncbi:hypothetical protein [Nocardia sp. 348MFTsu5.1]|uniref:TPR repeat region-containing protein n=1 Tax=Nocardia sp. 348MFTsu5.1 TaxID=1172185 RepID=UPI0003730FF9|nr:hypothetical protein [Nocardia sp. 348MFTsu5.1]